MSRDMDVDMDDGMDDGGETRSKISNDTGLVVDDVESAVWSSAKGH